MRNTKTLEINDKKFTVKELSNREIRDLFLGFAGKENNDPIEVFEVILKKLAGISYEDFLDFTPSEVKQVGAALMEVNGSFLEIPDFLRKVGLGDVYDRFIKSIKEEVLQKALTPLNLTLNTQEKAA